jgi:hypothetical protein
MKQTHDFMPNSQYMTSLSLATKFTSVAAVTVRDVRFEKNLQKMF